jgi:hypothetical protein
MSLDEVPKDIIAIIFAKLRLRDCARAGLTARRYYAAMLTVISRSSDFNTVLVNYCIHGYVYSTSQLLAHTCNIHAPTAIWAATKHGDPRLIKLLMSRSANNASFMRAHIWILAVGRGNVKMFKLLQPHVRETFVLAYKNQLMSAAVGSESHRMVSLITKLVDTHGGFTKLEGVKSHPDIVNLIALASKLVNPKILKFLLDNFVSPGD